MFTRQLDTASTGARARRAPTVRRFTTTTAATAILLALGALGACSDDETIAPAKPRYIYGPAQALGNGTARAYVTLDNANRPTTLGIAMSESAMSGLPQTPMPGMPMAATLNLVLPAEAAATGFDHATLDWNPAGHEPEHVYTLPHFDFHFYTITTAAQMAIMPTDPQFETKASKMPAAEYVPAGHVAASVLANIPPVAATIPTMGLHWLEVASAELHGQPFTKTFIYGSYDGRFIFAEPMITKAYLESVKAMPIASVSTPVGVAAKYEKAGYYPTQYQISWDASAKEYRVALSNLVQR